MKIITISREYGSGGRDLGRKIAQSLGFDYYDREIIATLAKENSLDENYLDRMLVKHQWSSMPFAMKKCAATTALAKNSHVSYLVKEKDIIQNIGKKGRNCVVVGRNADWYLKEYQPLNIFLCASIEDRLHRCMERKDEICIGNIKEMEKIIRNIDKNRSMAREVIAGNTWAKNTTYHLTVNTTGCDLDKLAAAVVAFAKNWFKI